MNNQTILVGIGVLVLVGLGGWFWTSGKQATPTPAQNTQQVVNQPREVTHTLSLVARKLTPAMVTVTQGDQITVKVMSDETGEFHISGYEIENDMEAGKELSFSFTADKAGRYNFELHPKMAENAEDIVVGAFVANPR